MLSVVAVGGTFEGLHAGHRALLEFAFSCGKKVVIGVCSDKMVSRTKPNRSTSSFASRSTEIRKFLEERGLLGRAELREINNFYGTVDKDSSVQGLVVSDEPSVLESAAAVNEAREANGLARLEIFMLPRVRDSKGRVISTSSLKESSEWKK